MRKIFLYNLSGEYWGFIYDNCIFDITNEYYGWLDNEGLAWYKNGKYLGNLFNTNYIIVNNAEIKPISRIVEEKTIISFKENLKISKKKRMKRTAPQGWSDALKKK